MRLGAGFVPFSMWKRIEFRTLNRAAACRKRYQFERKAELIESAGSPACRENMEVGGGSADERQHVLRDFSGWSSTAAYSPQHFGAWAILKACASSHLNPNATG